MTLYRFFRLGQSILYIMECTVFVYAILSWFRPSYNLYRWLENIVTPIIAPFKYLHDLLLSRFELPFDFSCWLTILGLQLINSLWWRLYLILRTIKGR